VANAGAPPQGPELAPKVDAARLVLWGTSYAGGHVLVTAAKLGGQVKAVVSQVCAHRLAGA